MSLTEHSKVWLPVCGATTHSLVLARRPGLQESDMSRSARKLSLVCVANRVGPACCSSQPISSQLKQ
eukprot:2076705-Rhodomonas_salina.1